MLSKRKLLQLLAVSSLLAIGACGRMSRMSDEECMTRVMYFESNRSSEDGMLAVGTVVMNRMKSGRYPTNVCAVVGQKNQFAPGVLSKPMGQGRVLAQKAARVVLHGGRHPAVGRAMFFHTAGYSYPYTNMQYVAVLGGNAFYEKRKNATSTQESVTPKAGRLPYEPAQREIMVAENTQIAPRRDVRPSFTVASARQSPIYRAPAPERFDPAPADALLAPTADASGMLAPLSIDEVIAQNGGGLY